MLEHLEVLGDRLQADWEGLGEFVHSRVAMGEASEQRAAGGVGKGGERAAEQVDPRVPPPVMCPRWVPGRAAGSSSSRHRDDADVGQPAVVDLQQTHGAFGLAAPIGRRTGIEDPLTVMDFVERDVRVPEHHQLSIGE